MMSPRANFYNYGYGGTTSPARTTNSSHRKAEVSSPPLVRKISPTPVDDHGRESPATAETVSESAESSQD
jgi:hypothetical protein